MEDIQPINLVKEENSFWTTAGSIILGLIILSAFIFLTASFYDMKAQLRWNCIPRVTPTVTGGLFK